MHPPKAALHLVYSGHQEGELLGIPGSGREIRYAGTAFCSFAEGRIARAWVLGDLDSLRRLITP